MDRWGTGGWESGNKLLCPPALTRPRTAPGVHNPRHVRWPSWKTPDPPTCPPSAVCTRRPERREIRRDPAAPDVDDGHSLDATDDSAPDIVVAAYVDDGFAIRVALKEPAKAATAEKAAQRSLKIVRVGPHFFWRLTLTSCFNLLLRPGILFIWNGLRSSAYNKSATINTGCS